MRRFLPTLAKIAISAILISVFVVRVGWREVLANLATVSPWAVAAAVAMLAVQALCSAWRYVWIASAFEIAIPWHASALITWIGLFFNQTLPSSVGGDGMRMWLIGRRGASAERAIASVITDRVVGLIALLALIGAMLPALYQIVPAGGSRTSLTAVVVVGAVMIAAGIVVTLFAGRLVLGGRVKLPARLTAALAGLVRLLSQSKWRVAAVLAASAGAQLATVVAIYAIAIGSGVAIPFWQCLALTLPVMMVASLPLSVAGWGLRESGFAVAFGFIGIAAAQAVTVSVVFGLAAIVLALPGGVLFGLTRSAARQSER